MFNTKKLTKLFAIGALALGVLVVAGCGDDTSKETKVNPDAKVINVATRGTVRPYSYTDDNGNLTGFDVELLKEIDVVIQTFTSTSSRWPLTLPS